MEPKIPAYLLSIVQGFTEDPGNAHTEELLAAAHNVSVSKLQKDFPIHFGCSFQQYLTKTRMERAAKLLIDTRQPVKSIARKLGYHSGESFARCFKKFSGFSPSAFRENH